jgi:hypothetical protein
MRPGVGGQSGVICRTYHGVCQAGLDDSLVCSDSSNLRVVIR